MALDLSELRRIVTAEGRVARIVVAETKGSTPRETGASMLVWKDGSEGTIGGGTLEFEAIRAARALVNSEEAWCRAVRTIPLGPAMGQCCGGAVTLLTEVFCEDELTALEADGDATAFLRPVTKGAPDPDVAPLPVRRAAERGESRLASGWLCEPLVRLRPQVWIYGAGHVGRALVHVLAPTGFAITWVDFAPDRFPATIPEGVTRLLAENPADAVRFASDQAHHLVITHSHALDLEICHRLLNHGFRSAGLIGSATKWARFRRRLGELGHEPAVISRIVCPIGRRELGKAPHSIAIGVAAELLIHAHGASSVAETRKELAS